jgi:hypothetical protein
MRPNPRVRMLIPAALGLATALLLPALAQDQIAQAEKIVEMALQQQVAPAKNYEVKIDPNGTNLSTGQVSKVEVTGTDVEVDEGIVIPEIILNLEGLKVNLAAKTLDSISKGALSITLDEESANKLLKEHAGPEGRGVKVAFKANKLLINRKRGGVMQELEAKPVIKGPKIVHLEITRGTVGVTNIPAAQLDSLEKEINPIINLRGLKVPVKIEKVDVKKDKLLVEATADFQKKKTP